jgi:pilus assembly protein Flp/PilA
MLSLVTFVQNWVARFDTEEEGQGLVEYALILVLIAIVVIGSLTLLGDQVDSVFQEITSGLGGA